MRIWTILPSTIIALSALLAMLAHVGTATLFAPAALPVMLAKAGTSTSLALTALPVMLANAGTATLFALVALPTMLTKAGTPTLFALAALLAMLAKFPLSPFRRAVRRDIAKRRPLPRNVRGGSNVIALTLVTGYSSILHDFWLLSTFVEPVGYAASVSSDSLPFVAGGRVHLADR